MNSAPHGGQVYQFAQTQKASTEETLKTVLDFSASINPIQPKISWPQLTQSAKIALKHYPDQQQQRLTQTIAQRFHLVPSQIMLTNGISSAILNLFSQIQPDITLLFTPIYSEYQQAAQRYSQTVIESNTLTLKPIQALTPKSVVVLVNPSTPQGLYRSPETLASVLKPLKKIGCWVWLDESFLPFIGFKETLSVRRQLTHWPKLMILQSLTKYYACPGVRIGALFAHPDTLHSLIWPSWPISTLDELFLQHALSDPKHDANTQTFLKTEAPRFIQALKQCKLIENVHKSHANFVLVKSDVKAAWLSEKLKLHHILIRDCNSFGLGKNHIRIAIKSKEHNQKLINALHTLENL
ncbi:MAG TPA: aminotransferase class I/II-fold pyridoxal phosphate-dependent enzyme [Thiomicrorhabdus sp.]|nr:aminotransferase class I/II-fold pyridoxal phosphate-dependent enzyme [Thiomicrorhabdus sp.]